MTPEEILAEEKRVERDKKVYPPYLVEAFIRIRKEIRTELETGIPIPYNPTKITDFTPMITCIWKISNKNYQEKHWVRREPPIREDCFDETTETFEEDAAAVLDQKDYCIEMTDKQREMLSRLLHLVEEYDGEDETPFKTYGRIDKNIVYGRKWDKIRQYAKLVYEEITGDRL